MRIVLSKLIYDRFSFSNWKLKVHILKFDEFNVTLKMGLNSKKGISRFSDG